jgi:hypothetical protein
MPPQQQHALIPVDSHNAGAGSRAHQAMLEMLSVGQFNIGNSYVQPVVDVQ